MHRRIKLYLVSWMDGVHCSTYDVDQELKRRIQAASWRLSYAHAHKQDPKLWRRQRRSRQCFRVSVSLIILKKSNVPAKRIKRLKLYWFSWICFVYRIDGGNRFGDDLRLQEAKQILYNGPSSPPWECPSLRSHIKSGTICRILQRYSAPCSAAYFSKLFHLCANRDTYQNHVKTCSSRNCYAKRKQHFPTVPKLEGTLVSSYRSVLWQIILSCSNRYSTTLMLYLLYSCNWKTWSLWLCYSSRRTQ